MPSPKAATFAVMGVGILLGYSALTGKGILHSSRSLLHGQKPVGQDNPITVPTPSGGIGGGSGPPGGAVGPVTGSEKDVMRAICLSLGAPPSQANVESLSAWRQHECPWDNQPPDGAEYTHNPFNTTLANGSTGTVNGVGVRIYPNWIVGIADTVATLRGGYPGIIAALRTGNGICGVAPDEFSKWSGGGYSSVC